MLPAFDSVQSTCFHCLLVTPCVGRATVITERFVLITFSWRCPGMSSCGLSVLDQGQVAPGNWQGQPYPKWEHQLHEVALRSQNWEMGGFPMQGTYGSWQKGLLEVLELYWPLGLHLISPHLHYLIEPLPQGSRIGVLVLSQTTHSLLNSSSNKSKP